MFCPQNQACGWPAAAAAAPGCWRCSWGAAGAACARTAQAKPAPTASASGWAAAPPSPSPPGSSSPAGRSPHAPGRCGAGGCRPTARSALSSCVAVRTGPPAHPHPHGPTTPTWPRLLVLEPVKTTPEPPPVPPTTTPEPAGKTPIPGAMSWGGTHKANCPPALPGGLMSLIVFAASVKLRMWRAQGLSAQQQKGKSSRFVTR